MKLLIITQAVDLDNPALGFFHSWIEEFARHVASVEVICLFEGRHALPANVRVHSLGKERYTIHNTRYKKNSILYVLRFLSLIVKLRSQYDAVFVHMNPEYVLLGGIFWKLFGKPVCLWRNHYQKHVLVPLAGRFVKHFFSTSRFAYGAGMKNALRMPVGVDTRRFPFGREEERVPRRILFLARMASSKRPHILLEALSLLKKEQVAFTAHFVGSPLPADEAYYVALKEQAAAAGLLDVVSFYAAVPNGETPALYRSADIFVNASPSGMFDKTIFEAMASGALTVAANKDLRELIDPRFVFEEDSPESLADRLAWVLSLSASEKDQYRIHKRTAAEAHSLAVLVPKILEVYEA